MKPVNIIIFASVLAVVGKWSQKKTIDSRMVVGGATLAIAFAVLQDAQPKLAESFSWLMLASVAGAYGEDVFTSIGAIVNGGANVATGKPASSGANAKPAGGAPRGSEM